MIKCCIFIAIVMTFFKTRLTSNGVHLFNRESGLNVLLDEIHPVNLSEAPTIVSIALTGRCNLHCRHCFVPKSDRELPFDRLIGWLQELDDNGCLGVGFGGGEPLLYSRIFDVCDFVHAKTKMACTMTTNGVLLNERVISRLSPSLNFCRISMDGVGKTHETLRGVSFDLLLSAIHATVKSIKVGINYLINDLTIGELDRAVQIAEGEGVSELLLLPEVSSNRDLIVSEACMCQLRHWVEDYDGPIPIRVSESIMDVFPNAVSLPGDRSHRAYMHIDSDGVLKSSSFSSSGVKITDGLIGSLRLCQGETNESME